MIIFEDSLLNHESFRAGNETNIPFSQGRLTQDTLYWWESAQQRSLAVADMVGVALVDDNEPFAAFVVSSYPLIHQSFGKPRRQLREYRFLCPTTDVRSRWITSIRGLLYNQQFVTAPRRFHAFINPWSGQKNGDRLFEKTRSLLEKSHITWSRTRTEGVGDAQRHVSQMDLTHLDGFIIVGGDGTVHEVINGLMNREDGESAIKIPIGIIPAGTGNGLCKTLLELANEPYDPISAAFLIARGKAHAIDLATVEQEQQRYYSILSIAWALPSQVDVESEKLRYLGSLRSTIYGLFRILFPCSYEGKFSFLPYTESINNDWQCLEGSFVLFWAMNLVWATYDLKVAPLACLDDGGMDIVVIRKGISRFRLLLAFLKCANGSHLGLPEVEYYKVQQFTLEPGSSQGILAIDGEHYQHSAIRVSIAQHCARVFSLSSQQVETSNFAGSRL